MYRNDKHTKNSWTKKINSISQKMAWRPKRAVKKSFSKTKKPETL
jgi:hypothetical protein